MGQFESDCHRISPSIYFGADAQFLVEGMSTGRKSFDTGNRPRRHLNKEERRALKSAAISKFTSIYAKKAQRGIEPNDRHYDRELEREIKRMKPETLDELLRDDEE